MTHTFDSEVSLHYWLIWPMVGRGGNRATKFLAELISSLKYKTSSNATIHSLSSRFILI
jgi:hypothetical protein